jgi:hypothetical protein
MKTLMKSDQAIGHKCKVCDCVINEEDRWLFYEDGCAHRACAIAVPEDE